MTIGELQNSIGDPHKLEARYRENPEEFRNWLKGALEESPTSETLRVWDARVNFAEPSRPPALRDALPRVILLSLVSGCLVKLPALLPIEEKWFYSRFPALIVFSALCAYFLSAPVSKRTTYAVVVALLLCALVLLWLPDASGSSSVTMSLVHMPLLLGSVLGVAYMADDWSQSDARLSYIRYVGEMIVYSVLILLGGMVLSLTTFGLFALIDAQIERWYSEYVVVFGLVASPIVATFLYDSVTHRGSRLASLIANVFAPLFLLTVVIYLVAILYQGKSPYADRDFLIAFNGLLLLVWAMTVFSISGKVALKTSGLADAVVISLIAITLMVNVTALSAIVFRWAEYGLTPNRVAVTGANLLVFGHLVQILRTYVADVKMAGAPSRLNAAITNYLPLYSIWSFFVVFALPVLFSFK
jgi:hypothetical protein